MEIPRYGELIKKWKVVDLRSALLIERHKPCLKTLLCTPTLRNSMISDAIGVQSKKGYEHIMKDLCASKVVRLDTGPLQTIASKGKKIGHLGQRLKEVMKGIDSTVGLQQVNYPRNHHTIRRIHAVKNRLDKKMPGGGDIYLPRHLTYVADHIDKHGIRSDGTISIDPAVTPSDQYDLESLAALGSHKYLNHLARAYSEYYLGFCSTHNQAPLPLETYMFGMAELFDIRRSNKNVASNNPLKREHIFHSISYATNEEMQHLESFFHPLVECKLKKSKVANTQHTYNPYHADSMQLELFVGL